MSLEGLLFLPKFWSNLKEHPQYPTRGQVGVGGVGTCEWVEWPGPKFTSMYVPGVLPAIPKAPDVSV